MKFADNCVREKRRYQRDQKRRDLFGNDVLQAALFVVVISSLLLLTHIIFSDLSSDDPIEPTNVDTPERISHLQSGAKEMFSDYENVVSRFYESVEGLTDEQKLSIIPMCNTALFELGVDGMKEQYDRVIAQCEEAIKDAHSKKQEMGGQSNG